MKLFTIKDIRSWNPCYDPNRHLSENFKGTALDILKHPCIPAADKLWVVLREDCIDSNTLHRFVCWVAAEILFLSGWNDKRSWDAIKAKLDFLDGIITESTRSDAEGAAESAAESAISVSPKAQHAAESAWIASFANESAWNVTLSAAVVAFEDSWGATRSAQVHKLINMLEQNSKFTWSDIINR